MIIERLTKPNTRPKTRHDQELVTALEKFSYDVYSFSKNVNIPPVDLVFVKTINDLPSAVNGEITLESNKKYILANSITTNNTLVIPTLGLITIESLSLVGYNWIYTGTSSAIKGTDILNLVCDNISFSSPNGSIFDITAVTFPNSAFVYLTDFIFNDCKEIGTICNCSFHEIASIWFNVGLGIIFDNSRIVTFKDVAIYDGKNTASTKMLTFKNNMDSVQVSANYIEYKSNETIFDFQNNWVSTSGATIANNTVNEDPDSTGGILFTSTGYDQTYLKINSDGNINIKDSTVRAALKIDGNTLSTTIATAATPTKINATYISDNAEERMNFQTGCTFNGTTDVITSNITHGLSNDDIVSFKVENAGTLPTGLSESTNYYVIQDTATTFKVSATLGGSAIDFTGNGTADQYYRHVIGNNEGVVVYIGLETVSVLISGWCSMKSAGGAAAKDFVPCVMKRSTSGVYTEIADGGIISPTNTRTLAAPVNKITELNTNEGISIYVENYTDTTNIDVTDLLVSIAKV